VAKKKKKDRKMLHHGGFYIDVKELSYLFYCNVLDSTGTQKAQTCSSRNEQTVVMQAKAMINSGFKLRLHHNSMLTERPFEWMERRKNRRENNSKRMDSEDLPGLQGQQEADDKTPDYESWDEDLLLYL